MGLTDRRRKRAIKELLARSVPLLDEWKEAGLLGSLKLPQEWLDEAKVRRHCCQIFTEPLILLSVLLGFTRILYG